MAKKSGKKSRVILIYCIFAFLMGAFLGILVYFSLFPTYSDKVEGGYFINYLDGSIIDLNDFYTTTGQGDSMYPTIPDNSISIIADDEIKVGDIIIFENFDKDLFGNYDYVEHRVVKIRERNGKLEYLTRGDNAKFVDDWVSEDYVFGKVVGVLY